MRTKNFVSTKGFMLLDETLDECIEIEKIKCGDVFYECSYTWGNKEIVALTDAKKTKKGWTCLVKDKNEEVFEIFVSAGTTYHPQFFKQPQVVDQDEYGDYGYYIE